jgi:tetratricopeptide (TPR) repeat protein
MLFLGTVATFGVIAGLYYTERKVDEKKKEVIKCKKLIDNRAYDKAINYCKALMEKYPKEPILYYYLGLTCYYIGELEAALENFKKAEELKDGLFNKINLSSILLNEIEFYRDYARVLKSAKKYNESFEYYSKALDDAERQRKSSKIGEILREIAETYEELGDINNAIDYYKELLIYTTDKLSLYRKIAELYKEIGDMEKYNRYEEKAWNTMID